MNSITGFIVADVYNPEQAVVLFKILLAAALGFAIGWNRRSKHAGIRTFTLITLGSCLFTIISIDGFPMNTPNADQARMVAQIVSGIGFIGAGVIWKNNGSLTGLTTAAGIWVSAAVGIAAGAGMFLLSIISTALILFIFNIKGWILEYEKEDNDVVRVHMKDGHH